ncbi:TrmH family RNA methyltransferase [Parahaliea mediterranea]|uniref:RNA methyltransferase n=1 Tax=Parahaliea mediterranea TaxID=651086 RepID=A0A939DIB3_9GAMM|nr:RNA methyltransferase [Parahaliea mediterranea]
MSDSPEYRERKAFFDRVLTVYGRKPVLEVLQNPQLHCHALHLAQSNREQGLVRDIRALAESRDIPVNTHSREALARISRNGRQDQGVAVDVLCPAFRQFTDALPDLPPRARLLALDGITNPQNLGMIIRSAAAGEIDGILYARGGNAALGPLVIKASAGTLYRAPLLLCDSLPGALRLCRERQMEVCALAADATQTLFEFNPDGGCVYVLGNETEGVSPGALKEATRGLAIPMRNGVESLNVAVTASLIAYAGLMRPT